MDEIPSWSSVVFVPLDVDVTGYLRLARDRWSALVLLHNFFCSYFREKEKKNRFSEKRLRHHAFVTVANKYTLGSLVLFSLDSQALFSARSGGPA